MKAVVTVAAIIRFHTLSSPAQTVTQFTEDVLIRGFPNSTCSCVNEHELMMLVKLVADSDIISDNLLEWFFLVIGLCYYSLLINKTNDPSLITNPNHPASVDTIFVFVVGYVFSLAKSFRVDDETMCRWHQKIHIIWNWMRVVLLAAMKSIGHSWTNIP